MNKTGIPSELNVQTLNKKKSVNERIEDIEEVRNILRTDMSKVDDRELTRVLGDLNAIFAAIWKNTKVGNAIKINELCWVGFLRIIKFARRLSIAQHRRVVNAF